MTILTFWAVAYGRFNCTNIILRASCRYLQNSKVMHPLRTCLPDIYNQEPEKTKKTTRLSIQDCVQQNPMPVTIILNFTPLSFLPLNWHKINFGFYYTTHVMYTAHVHELLWHKNKQFSVCKTSFSCGIQNVVWNHCNLSFCLSSEAHTTCRTWLHLSRLHAPNSMLTSVVFFFTFFTKDFQAKERRLAESNKPKVRGWLKLPAQLLRE